MKYTIEGLLQKKLLERGLRLEHAHLIRYFIDFRDTGKMISKKFDDGHPYYWIKYEAVIEQLPLLRIKKDSLYRKFRDIVDQGILETYCEKSPKGSFSFYRAGPNLEILLSKSTPGNKSEWVEIDEKDTPPGKKSECPTRKIIRTRTENNPYPYGKFSVPKDYSIKDYSIKDTVSKDTESGVKKTPQKDLKNTALLNRDELTVSDDIIDIIQSAISAGGFSDHLKYRYKNKRTKEPSKTFKQIIAYIKEINSGAFYRKYEWELEWIRKQNIRHIPPEDGYQDYDRVKKIILKSCRRAGKARANKIEYVPQSLADYFYNPETKKSRFLYFLNNDILTPDDIRLQKIIDRIPDDVYEMADSTLDHKGARFYGREELMYWSTVNKLCKWYRESSDRLYPYNRAYHDNGWGYHCGCVEGFMRFVFEYVQYETWKLQPKFMLPDPDNPYWEGFCDYMEKHYNVGLIIDTEKEAGIADAIEEQRRESEELTIDREIDKIKRNLEHDNIPIPGYEKLREVAEKHIREENEEKEKI